MTRRTLTTATAVAGAITAAAILLAGCSSQPADSAEPTEEGSDLSTIVDGTLTVGTSPSFPPMEWKDGEALVGADVDLITEVADRLGLEITFQEQNFDQLINSLRTDRVDAVISGMSDTVERQKTLDFVDYFSAAARLYTTGDQAQDYAEDTDICGAAVAVSTKTDYYPIVQRFFKELCDDQGLDPISLVEADSGSAARLQLDQGRAQVAVQGAPNLAYFEQTEPGKYAIVGPVLAEQSFGVSVKKGNTALAEAVHETLQEMSGDGTTEEILGKYGIADGLLEPVINGVTE